MSQRIQYGIAVLTIQADGKDDRVITIGQTLRMTGHSDAFSDAIITGISRADEYGTTWLAMARPHCMATMVGTSMPGVATMVEQYEITLTQFLAGYKLADKYPRTSGDTKPADRKYDSEKATVRI